MISFNFNRKKEVGVKEIKIGSKTIVEAVVWANSQPVTITNNRGKNGVLISEDDWNAIQETLYLNSIQGMTESILEAGQEPVSEGTIYNPEEEW